MAALSKTQSYTETLPIEITQLKPNNPNEEIVQLAAGADSSGALTAGGNIFVWGSNTRGTLAPIEDDMQYLVWPYLVDSSGVRFKSMSMSKGHVAAISTDGDVYTWGQNKTKLSFFGELFGGGRCKGLGHSNGAPTEYPTRVEFPVSENLKFAQVECGEKHTLALTEDGEVWVWGSGEFGRLGNGSTSDALTPEPSEVMSGISGCKQVVCGEHYSGAVTDDGDLYMWGRNDHGQLGVGSTGLDMNNLESIPTKVNLSGVQSVSCGSGHSLAITEDGKLYGWGMKRKMVPDLVHVDGDVKFVTTACGDKLSVAISDEGEVYTWGKGYVTSPAAVMRAKFPALVPSDMLSDCNATSVVCGRNHILASGNDRADE